MQKHSDIQAAFMQYRRRSYSASSIAPLQRALERLRPSIAASHCRAQASRLARSGWSLLLTSRLHRIGARRRLVLCSNGIVSRHLIPFFHEILEAPPPRGYRMQTAVSTILAPSSSSIGGATHLSAPSNKMLKSRSQAAPEVSIYTGEQNRKGVELDGDSPPTYRHRGQRGVEQLRVTTPFGC